MNWDPLGKLIVELRADSAVAAIAGANPTSSPARVRGVMPKPPTDSYDGDAHGPGSYRAFVVVINLGGIRMRRVPVSQPRLVARCYGRTHEEAMNLATAVSNALHYVGPRVFAGGLGFYATFTDDVGDQDEDPDTRQPMVPVFIDLTATTQAVV